MSVVMIDTPKPFSPEDMARRKKRAIAMALVLLALVILFFVTTLVRMGGSM
jgi:accessory gene regulator protein AgrB